jgi:hypothetical protein
VQVVDWLDEHYEGEDPARIKKIKKRFQKHDPDADMGL